MKPRPTPLSDRIQTEPITPELVRELQGLERVTSAGVAHVVSNNKHPRDWPLERWLAVLTFAMGLSGAIIGAIWLAGGEWRAVQEAVALVPVLVTGQAETKAEVQAVGVQVEQIQDEQRRVMQELSALTPEPARVLPRLPMGAFPRSEQSNFGRRE